MLEVLDERISVVSVPNVHWTDGARSTSPPSRTAATPSARGW